MNTIVTEPRNVRVLDGSLCGHVVIEAITEDAYTRQPRMAGHLRLRGVDAEDVEIVSLFVEPHGRRRGLGSRLLEEACEIGAGLGRQRAWIEVVPVGMTDTALMGFLERNHFRLQCAERGLPLQMVREMPPRRPLRLSLDDGPTAERPRAGHGGPPANGLAGR